MSVLVMILIQLPLFRCYKVQNKEISWTGLCPDDAKIADPIVLPEWTQFPGYLKPLPILSTIHYCLKAIDADQFMQKDEVYNFA